MGKQNINIQINDRDVEDSTMEIAPWESLGISDDFLFCKIMQNEKFLLELVQMIIPGVRISHLDIEPQKTIEIGLDIHGVRFDVYAVDQNGPAFTVEMQVLDKQNLPKRIRYYLSIADTRLLEKGVEYDRLSDSYVIMICPFDLFGLGLHKYTFTYRCEEKPELELEDGTMNVVLNAIGTADDVDDKLKAFLDYVMGIMSDDDYVRRLDMAVQEAKMNSEWRREYIVMRQNEMIMKRDALEAGLVEGRALGIEQGARAIIEIVKEYGGSSDDAEIKIESKMGMSPEESKKLVETYW